MTDQAPTDSHRYRSVELIGNRVRRFNIVPSAEALAAYAEELDLQGLTEVRFKGELRPTGRSDVTLEARLQAQAVQSCVVSLAPVPVTLDVEVRRVYVHGMEMPTGDEVEMPEDDTREPLPELIDVDEVLVEALALALPDYPRAPGAEHGARTFAGEGVEPMSDDNLRPFAGLAALKGQLAAKGDE